MIIKAPYGTIEWNEWRKEYRVTLYDSLSACLKYNKEFYISRCTVETGFNRLSVLGERLNFCRARSNSILLVEEAKKKNLHFKDKDIVSGNKFFSIPDKLKEGNYISREKEPFIFSSNKPYSLINHGEFIITTPEKK